MVGRGMNVLCGLVLLVLWAAGSVARAGSVGPSPNAGPDAGTQQAAPYVVLVSLSGFRYDYANKYGAPSLEAIAEHGAWAAAGMIPAYPASASPNQYTLATGLYPEHHGIVADSFYDPARQQRFLSPDSKPDAKTATDGSWYGGTPLWVLAERQGMRTACLHWVGCEVEIGGVRPSYSAKSDRNLRGEPRIEQVNRWLQLPPETRPHLILFSLSDVDRVGRAFGPDAPETRDAVHRVDDLLGKLGGSLEKLHLPIDLIVVSDAGMETEQGPWINLEKYADLSQFETVGSLLYPKTEDAAAKAYGQLKIVSGRFKVYRRNKMPPELAYNANARVGDPVVVATGPYAIRAHALPGPAEDRPPDRGVNGFDPQAMTSMRAIFYAEGPDIRAGGRVRPFENVNVYPFIATLLRLNTPKVDGSANVLSSVIKEPAPAPDSAYDKAPAPQQ